MPAPLARSDAARTSLLAKVALCVVAPVAIGGAILGLKPIPTPHFEPPILEPEGGQTDGAAIRPVNYSAMTRVLTLAAEFPPPPEVTIPDEDGTEPGPTTSTPGLPVVRFLGAIAEPGRYVALLNIDGRQKFLGPGEMYAGVRVLECSASEVKVQFDSADGSQGASQAIAVAQREGPGWTTGTPTPISTEQIEAGEASGEIPSAMPSFPGLPPGVTLPPGMSPQQVEQLRRDFEARQRSGDSPS